MMQKAFSTHCVKCGLSFEVVEKKKKRALCVPCFKISVKEYQQQHNKRVEVPIYTKYQEYKVENRMDENLALSKRLLAMNDRAEWKEAIRLRLEEIIADKGLWDFICRDMEVYKKRKIHKTKYEKQNLEDYEQF